MDNFFTGCPAKMNDSRFLTDYRTSNTREQYLKSINNISRNDEYRSFLQQNGGVIMDAEWDFLKVSNTCKIQTCVHTNPTRSTNGMDYTELKLHDKVRTGKLNASDVGYPVCRDLHDYRMTETDNKSF